MEQTTEQITDEMQFILDQMPAVTSKLSKAYIRKYGAIYSFQPPFRQARAVDMNLKFNDTVALMESMDLCEAETIMTKKGDKVLKRIWHKKGIENPKKPIEIPLELFPADKNAFIK